MGSYFLLDVDAVLVVVVAVFVVVVDVVVVDEVVVVEAKRIVDLVALQYMNNWKICVKDHTIYNE